MDWTTSRVRGTAECRQWRHVVKLGKFVLGCDTADRWVHFVETTGEIILADANSLLFFLPLLDNEYGAFIAKMPSMDAGRSLAINVVCVGLRERGQLYIDRALRWSEPLLPSAEIEAALRELSSSKRGTQAMRQEARGLLNTTARR
jgi:hypothetical protein